ncbi:MAG: hypothetical protein P4L83_18270 [Nevskia sp.]|nr:hypothetical protein [Nevskia sp.]
MDRTIFYHVDPEEEQLAYDSKEYRRRFVRFAMFVLVPCVPWVAVFVWPQERLASLPDWLRGAVALVCIIAGLWGVGLPVIWLGRLISAGFKAKHPAADGVSVLLGIVFGGGAAVGSVLLLRHLLYVLLVREYEDVLGAEVDAAMLVGLCLAAFGAFRMAWNELDPTSERRAKREDERRARALERETERRIQALQEAGAFENHTPTNETE